MDEEFRPFDNDCIWYFIILAVATIIVAWIFVLVGCFAKLDPCRDKCEQPWPLNLVTWEYAPQNVVIYILWSAAILFYLWGSNHATCIDTISDERRLIYRAIYAGVMLLMVADFLLFFVFHHVSGALTANILGLVLIIGAVFLYSEIDIDDGWAAVPLMLWFAYRSYTLYYIIGHNPDLSSPDVRLQ